MIRLIVIAGVTFVGCGSKAAKKQSAPVAPPAVATTEAGPAMTEAKPVEVSPNVNVSDEVVKHCKLHFASVQDAPKFELDQAQLLPQDRSVLEQVADCLVKGPLQGRTVQLIGRADSRGTEEYNLGLGTRRADTVRSFLERLGVPGARLVPATRGALDASGVDETGWQNDRRVDLRLAN